MGNWFQEEKTFPLVSTSSSDELCLTSSPLYLNICCSVLFGVKFENGSNESVEHKN